MGPHSIIGLFSDHVADKCQNYYIKFVIYSDGGAYKCMEKGFQ